jgi:hypothetical protein
MVRRFPVRKGPAARYTGGMSRRILVLLLLLAAAVAAEGDRAAYLAARDALQDAYFDELEPDQRDRLFEALRSWDHPEIVKDVGLIAARYGTYLDGLEGQLEADKEKLALYSGRSALTEQEIGLRNSYTRKIEKAEKIWTRARASDAVFAQVIGSFKEKETIDRFLALWPKQSTWRVRQLLARACAFWHKSLFDEKMSKRFFATLKKLGGDETLGVRLAVVRSLAAFERPEAFELLVRAAGDNDWRLRAEVVAVLAKIQTNEAVDVLVERLGKEEGRLQDDIVKVLRERTGENFQYAEEWQRWWVSVDRRVPAKPSAAATEAEAEAAKGTVHFYGIPTRSDRICFIIDISSSMNKEVEQFKRAVITGRKQTEEPVEGKTRLEVAQNELKRAIDNLNPKKQFMIVFFNNAVRTWRDEMTRADPSGKSAAKKDIELVRASGTTYTLGALREAFRVAGAVSNASGPTSGPKHKPLVDTIFLLSDGGPTDNKMEDAQAMDPEIILAAVREWNRDSNIVIHTIAVDTEEVGTYFLKQLASQNGGHFVERRR